MISIAWLGSYFVFNETSDVFAAKAFRKPST